MAYELKRFHPIIDPFVYVVEDSVHPWITNIKAMSSMLNRELSIPHKIWCDICNRASQLRQEYESPKSAENYNTAMLLS